MIWTNPPPKEDLSSIWSVTKGYLWTVTNAVIVIGLIIILGIATVVINLRDIFYTPPLAKEDGGES